MQSGYNGSPSSTVFPHSYHSCEYTSLQTQTQEPPTRSHGWPLIGNLPILFTNTEVPLHITLTNMAHPFHQY
ncbi:hypothetical protein FRX31_030621 [Thalictrum thalictroides]|uniref:Uncharacterized protein n=1 Tax=Thalictrum thalictroides TaxID=46969 RepID=A0A7J6V6G8_THATH|nr:hypothetical protein FRX31_030621 [Thalictrum thalictroides]